MKVSAVSVCVFVFSAGLTLPVMAADSAIGFGAGSALTTKYVETPAGIVGAPPAGAKPAPAPDPASGSLEIPEPAVIALFGLVALAIGHRLRRAKA